MRAWQVQRRKRTGHLIELGGLVVKDRIVELANDDRATIYAHCSGRPARSKAIMEQACNVWADKGERRLRPRNAIATLSHNDPPGVS
jgi:hypothetical protein